MNKNKNLDLEYTGIRVVPNKMHKDVINWILHLQRYVFALKYSINKKILDAACGSGYGMSILSSLAKSVEGIDIDKKTVEWAKINNHFYSPAKFKIQDLEKDKISGNFNCVISFETIEHLDNPEFLLNNLRCSLVDYGLFIFSVPVNEPHNQFHKKNYTWESINELIKKYFSSHTEWYSQTKEGIFKGRRKNALFAIGVSYKNLLPFLKRIEEKIHKTGHFLKRKTKEKLGLTPKSRW